MEIKNSKKKQLRHQRITNAVLNNSRVMSQILTEVAVFIDEQENFAEFLAHHVLMKLSMYRDSELYLDVKTRKDVLGNLFKLLDVCFEYVSDDLVEKINLERGYFKTFFKVL